MARISKADTLKKYIEILVLTDKNSREILDREGEVPIEYQNLYSFTYASLLILGQNCEMKEDNVLIKIDGEEYLISGEILKKILGDKYKSIIENCSNKKETTEMPAPEVKEEEKPVKEKPVVKEPAIVKTPEEEAWTDDDIDFADEKPAEPVEAEEPFKDAGAEQEIEETPDEKAEKQEETAAVTKPEETEQEPVKEEVTKEKESATETPVPETVPGKVKTPEPEKKTDKWEALKRIADEDETVRSKNHFIYNEHDIKYKDASGFSMNAKFIIYPLEYTGNGRMVSFLIIVKSKDKIKVSTNIDTQNISQEIQFDDCSFYANCKWVDGKLETMVNTMDGSFEILDNQVTEHNDGIYPDTFGKVIDRYGIKFQFFPIDFENNNSTGLSRSVLLIKTPERTEIILPDKEQNCVAIEGKYCTFESCWFNGGGFYSVEEK